MAENIRVAVRCRPFNSHESALGSKKVITIVEGKIVKAKSGSESKSADDEKVFSYDHAYDMDSTQDQVYQDIGEPLIQKSIDGFNGTIFAYGQTGSGKTHSMMGNPSDIGIIPRLNTSLFKSIQSLKTEENDFLVVVSYMEIYNEVIQDLLDPKKSNLKIREHPNLGVYVQNLSEIVVKEEADILKLIEEGNTIRKVASTKMNTSSSRSHSVIIIRVEQKSTVKEGDIEREKSLSSKLNLVDMAGSERASETGAQGDRLKEGASINKSVSGLGDLISSLTEARGEKYAIPYRNTKLTHLLKESLGGNSLTTMIAAISPADYNLKETVSTLKIAARVKTITNEVSRNEDVYNEKMIWELKDKLEKLKAQVASKDPQSTPSSAPVVDEGSQQRLEELEKIKTESWADKEALSAELEKERKKNMSTAISDIVDDVKAEKLEKIKFIKKIQNNQKILAKVGAAKKEEYGKSKKQFKNDMESYQKLEKEFEKPDLDEAIQERIKMNMTKLLTSLERNRDSLAILKKELKKIKAEAEENETKLTEAKADLMSLVSLLNENGKLRQSIIADAKAQWEAEKDDFFTKEFGEEREKIQSEKKALFDRIQKLEEENNSLRENLEKLDAVNTENQELIVIKDVDLETLTEETHTLRATITKLESTLAREKEEYKGQILELEGQLEERDRSIKKFMADKEADINQKQKSKEKDNADYEMFLRIMKIFSRRKNQNGG